tara:strand:- start:13910 stop:14770 length:861 start_codon:yes stop_codon:yes gene_type:complete
MQDKDFNFVKIPIAELNTKFSTLASDKGQVNIWRKGELPVRHRAQSFQSGKTSILEFFKEENFTSKTNEKIYFSFRLSGIEYYGVGLSSQGKEDSFALKLASEIFRSEKRGKERLLTFPHHQVYTYFNFPSAKAQFRGAGETGNVVSLSGFRKPLKEIKREVFTDPVKNFIKTTLDDNDDLLGYRVLDLSSNGIAFLVNAREKDLFKDLSDAHVTLLYDRTSFEVNQAKVVYIVDSLTGSTKGNPLYKVGLTFPENEKLSTLVHRKLESSNAKEGAQQDFEDFIDD